MRKTLFAKGGVVVNVVEVGMLILLFRRVMVWYLYGLL
jgi:hypothetical protein